MMRTISAFVFCLVASVASAESLTLSPHYKATGTNPDGSSYSGDVAVNIISTTTFSIVWKIGSSTYTGFGMRMNDSLAATYTIEGEPGLVIYKVDGDGLNGLWAVKGQNGNGTEKLTPVN